MFNNKNLNFQKTSSFVSKYYLNYPDFPIKGIQFKDFSPLWLDQNVFQTVINFFYNFLKTLDFDGIITAEARGFVIASPLAYLLKKPLILGRKEKKLPGELYKTNYSYEYASESLAIKKECLKKNNKYIFIDDVWATGETFAAISRLVKTSQALIICHLYIAILKDLKNENKLNVCDCFYLTEL